MIFPFKFMPLFPKLGKLTQSLEIEKKKKSQLYFFVSIKKNKIFNLPENNFGVQ